MVQRHAIFFSAVPGSVGAIMVSPSQSQVSLSWDPPLMPNGIIIAYEVSYRPTASSEPETRVNTTALVTHFTTEDNLEEDTEFFFSVRAYTRVGPGNISSLTVSTLAKTSEINMQEPAHYYSCFIYFRFLLLFLCWDPIYYIIGCTCIDYHYLVILLQVSIFLYNLIYFELAFAGESKQNTVELLRRPMRLMQKKLLSV